MTLNQTDFITMMLSRDTGRDHCLARYSATGVTTLLKEFLVAEQERGTDLADLIYAVALLHAGMISALLAISLKPDCKRSGTENFLAMYAMMIRAGVTGEVRP